MMKIKAIIIEDEIKSRDTLRNMLMLYCPNVEIIGEAMTVEEGRKLILKQKPDLVFLDIELPEKDGFYLFQYFPNPSFDVIFTTAYDQYAIQAFRIAAVDYLLKPINVDLLEEAIKRVIKIRKNKKNDNRLGILKSNYNARNFQKIALPSSNGYVFLEIKSIIACEASRSYTNIYTKAGEKYIVSKPLVFLEKSLQELRFFRINRSYIINLDFLKSYTRTHRGEVTLINGMTMSLSENKKEAFLSHLNI